MKILITQDRNWVINCQCESPNHLQKVLIEITLKHYLSSQIYYFLDKWTPN